jgi:hypothetical protein
VFVAGGAVTGFGWLVVVGAAVVVVGAVVVVVGSVVVVVLGSVVVVVEEAVSATADGASLAVSVVTNATIDATTRTHESQAARTRGRIPMRVPTTFSPV